MLQSRHPRKKPIALINSPVKGCTLVIRDGVAVPTQQSALLQFFGRCEVSTRSVISDTSNLFVEICVQVPSLTKVLLEIPHDGMGSSSDGSGGGGTSCVVVSPGEHTAVQGVSPLFRMQPSSPNAAFPFGAMFEDSPLTGMSMHQIGSTSIHVSSMYISHVHLSILQDVNISMHSQHTTSKLWLPSIFFRECVAFMFFWSCVISSNQFQAGFPSMQV